MGMSTNEHAYTSASSHSHRKERVFFFLFTSFPNASLLNGLSMVLCLIWQNSVFFQQNRREHQLWTRTRNRESNQGKQPRSTPQHGGTQCGHTRNIRIQRPRVGSQTPVRIERAGVDSPTPGQHEEMLQDSPRRPSSSWRLWPHTTHKYLLMRLKRQIFNPYTFKQGLH